MRTESRFDDESMPVLIIDQRNCVETSRGYLAEIMPGFSVKNKGNERQTVEPRIGVDHSISQLKP